MSMHGSEFLRTENFDKYYKTDIWSTTKEYWMKTYSALNVVQCAKMFKLAFLLTYL